MSLYYPVYGERLMGYAIFEPVDSKADAEHIARAEALEKEGDMIITIPRALTKEQLIEEFGEGIWNNVQKAQKKQKKHVNPKTAQKG